MKVFVGVSADFPEGAAAKVEALGRLVAVVRIGGELFAIGDTCSHAKCSLSEGDLLLEEREIECWKHGSTFSLVDGKPQCLPATAPVPVYVILEDDGKVYVEVEG